MSVDESPTIPHGPPVISLGQHVVMKYTQDKGSYILRADLGQKMGQTRVNLEDLAGRPFTQIYEQRSRRFELVHDVNNSELVFDEEGDEESGKVNSKGNVEDSTTTQQLNAMSNTEINQYLNDLLATSDNRKPVKGDNSVYVDSNTAQKLSTADIIKLREEGLSGAEIVKSLMENSATFGIKSDFAQAKYIKRKEKKYRKLYQVLPANPATICETYTYKNRDKVMNLRYDSLAQILSHSGVHSGAHVMVVESMSGLITGAVAYRMRGQGRILTVYAGQQPHYEIVRAYNLEPKDIEIIQPIPATELGPAAKDVKEKGFHTPDPLPNLEEEEERIQKRRQLHDQRRENDEAALKGSNVAAVAEDAATGTVEEDTTNPSNAEDSQNNKKRKREDTVSRPMTDQQLHQSIRDNLHSTGRAGLSRDRVNKFLRQGVDRLIIACKYRPLPILKQALQLLAPSAPFVIFHEFMEPLVDCYLFLQEQELAVKLVLSETWTREFQTLPGRFRPDMFMNATGGYLLTGIYVGMPAPYNVRTASEERVAAAHQQARVERHERHQARGKHNRGRK